jgi:uncharacterized heparinase superfamily protein
MRRPLTVAARYCHTLRHLKPAQVWGRMVLGLPQPSPDLRPAPPMCQAAKDWQLPLGRRPSMVGRRRFLFLNEEGALPPGSDWELPGRSKLWLYNLHYFDDLNAVGASERVDWHQELVARWIAENPPGTGGGWEPYPTSLRIVNWIKWAWAGNPLGSAAHQSLAVQTRWLRRRLEIHLLGNHLFANAKALVFAGCYFQGSEAKAWLQRGMTILVEEIPEQVLPDGGHFERSTMYHALAFEDMLDLLNLAAACPAPFTPWASSVSHWPEVAQRMGRWLSAMCHPDGEIAFFNDAAMGIAPTPAALTEYARRLGVDWDDASRDGVVWLEHSGYVRAQRDGAVLFADVAPIGPDYLPAHAHADTLTFELSVHGQRVVVNSGTSCYGLGKQREFERGTAAHNTVEVEGQNSSEVWAGFRVARRARPFDVVVGTYDDVVRIEGAHDGYRRLRGRVVHRRTWELRNGAIEVIDRLEGRAGDAMARLHFHPAVTLENNGVGGVARWNGGGVSWETEGCEPYVVASTWHPEFGVSLSSSALALRFEGSGRAQSCRSVLKWRGVGE